MPSARTQFAWATAPLLLMVLCGALSALVYLALTLRMPLQEFFPGPLRETLDFQNMLGPDWKRNAFDLYGSLATLVVLWAVAVAAAKQLPPAVASLVAFALLPVFVGILAFLYPPFAVDLFHNLGDGQTFWREGGNPMTTGPGAHFPIDLSYGDQGSAYGPLWYLLTGPPILLGGGHYLLSLVLLKVWVGMFYLSSAGLTWWIARQLRPGREGVALVMMAWNPFIVLRAVGNAHNDIVMMFFLLLAIALVVARRIHWVPLALAASVLVKFVTLLAVPAFLVYLWRLPPGERKEAFKTAGLDLVAAVAFAAAVAAPFWEGLGTFDQLRWQGSLKITSVPLLLRYQLEHQVGLTMSSADRLSDGITALVFLAVAGMLLYRQRRGAEGLIAVCAAMLLAYPLIALGWFRPWYLLWSLALIPLLPGRWWAVMAVVVTIAGLTPDILEQYRDNVSWLRPHFFWMLLIPVATVVLPISIAWLIGGWVTRRMDLLPADSDT